METARDLQIHVEVDIL